MVSRVFHRQNYATRLLQSIVRAKKENEIPYLQKQELEEIRAYSRRIGINRRIIYRCVGIIYREPWFFVGGSIFYI